MSKELIIPKGYSSPIDVHQTEIAIKEVKEFFQDSLAAELKLRRVTAPLFVLRGTGINDDLGGWERPVSFPVKDMDDSVAEVVHSLAKWKRIKLKDLNIKPHYGIYTDMNAIRADETLTNLHSLYVDQWDWELSINEEDRNINFLKKVVKHIYSAISSAEFHIHELYPAIKPTLPEEIAFIHSEELLKMYPDLSPKEREDKITEKHGAVFIMGIGHTLSNGEKHDDRAPDYDDWSTPNNDGFIGLNGDIMLWNPVLNRAFEISSMGIRVSKEALEKQLQICGKEERKKFLFHQMMLNNELPFSIGGGIGQSRLCMFLLKKAHIGEVQASIWPDEMKKKCKENNINLM
ncbi:aspartate--ammonia ligase [Cytophagaceae bacterium ABcell3]|nr:aspartate--ammonia ligase [Cytophagaceae bacterium ABcell3]